MKWEFPWVLLAAIIAPALVLLLHRWSEGRARKKLDGLIAPRLRERLLGSVDFKKRWRKMLVIALAFDLLLVALARPQWGFQQQEVERSSVDFIIALDLSRSMLAEDAEGKSRLNASKAAILNLLDKLGSDRVGLIAFAGDAFLAAPVTQDHEAIKRNLEALEPEAIAKQGSDMAKAIQLGLKTFSAGKYDSKALILVTDGEELQGDAIVAAREAGVKGMAVFTVGVGSPVGARIPLPQPRPGTGGFARNEFGKDVMTRLNERMLQQLAAGGRGSYQPLGKDGEGLIDTWKIGLAPLAKGTQTKPSKDLEEHFQWPLALGLAALLIEMLVSDRKSVLKPIRA